MNLEKIDVETLSYADGTTVVGQPQVPGLSTQAMQKSVENLGRNVIVPKVNELVDAANDSYSKAETDAAIEEKIVEIGAGDMAKAVYDPEHTIQNAGGISAAIAAEKARAEAAENTLNAAAVKSVNGEMPDENGNAAIDVGVKFVPVWVNDSPGSGFTAQTVTTLDLSLYKCVAIHYVCADGNGNVNGDNGIYFYEVGRVGYTASSFNKAGSGMWMMSRIAAVNSNNTVVFDHCYQGSATSAGIGTNNFIPKEIYGVRGVE